MVSFNCDGCGDVVKKPKLQQHFQRCYAPVTCLDCSMQFNSPNEFKGHNTCISEAEKYERSVYRGPKHGQQGGHANNGNGTPQKKQQNQQQQTSTLAKETPVKQDSSEKASGKRKRDEDEEEVAAPAAAETSTPAKKEKKEKSEKKDKKEKKEKSEKKEKKDKSEKKDKKEKEKEKKEQKEKKEKKEKKQSESDEDFSDASSTDSDADDSSDSSDSYTSSSASIHDSVSESDDDEHVQNDPSTSAAEEARIIKPLSTSELEEFKKKQRKLGIIYISRIPPGMTPAKVRHILSNFGELGRIYLQDGSKTSSKKRSSVARYTEGWVEFTSKKVAKAAAEMLNAQPIGGLAASNSKKSGSGGGSSKMGKSSKRFQDDVWTMKYLPGFKWHMLSEQMAQERASHAARLRTELSQSAYEQKDYLKKVERARVQKDKLERRRKRAEKEGTGEVDEKSGMEKSRSFRQRVPVLRDIRDQA